LEQFPDLKNAGEAPRYGIVHRLDKDTSGVLLVAKSTEALIFLQKQFKNREVEKKYLALATGIIKEDNGTIYTLIGRSNSDPRKQVAHSLGYKGKADLREAVSEYKVLQRFANHTLLEVEIKTGRKHQIRCHLAYIHHPVAGDSLYGFKDSPVLEGLNRQFLHASYLKIVLPSGQIQELYSDLPEDLKNIINNLGKI
jgi:23S rRNA pseudouridine1911/1915/1917 synthase